MKKYWSFDDIQKDFERLETRRAIVEKLEGIDIDFAGYSADNVGDMMRIFIYPMIDDELKPRNEFNETELRAIKKDLESAFGFKNGKLPTDSGYKKGEYGEHQFYWRRDFYTTEGSFHVIRKLERHIDDKYDLYISIEQAPKLNCRVVKKERTITQYEAICD